MNFMRSKAVTVYPASNRENNPRAVFTSEVNLTNSLRVGNSFESYLIDNNGVVSLSGLEFVLGGYYFKLDSSPASMINGYNSSDNDYSDLYLLIATSEERNSSEDSKSKSNNTFLNLDNLEDPAPFINNVLDETVGQNTNFTGLALVTKLYLKNNVYDSNNIPSRGHNEKRLVRNSNGEERPYLVKFYWLRLGGYKNGSLSNPFIVDPTAILRYDQKHIGIIENNIIKRIPQITTMSVSEFNEGGRMNFPPNSEKGDILIVYNDESVPIPN